MGTILNDVRFAVRLLTRSPVLTFVAAMSLGLGIGANTTIFTLINEVFLRPLPLREPSRLVSVFTADERNRQQAFGGFMPTSRLNFEDYKQRNEVFEGLVAYGFTAVSLSGGGEPEQVPAEIVSPGYFSLLGAPLVMGPSSRYKSHSGQGGAFGESSTCPKLPAGPLATAPTRRSRTSTCASACGSPPRR